MKRSLKNLLMLVVILTLLAMPIQTHQVHAASSQYVLSSVTDAAMEGYSYADRETMMRSYYDGEKARGTGSEYAWLIQDGKHTYDIGRIIDGKKGTEDFSIIYSVPLGMPEKSALKIPYTMGWSSTLRPATGSLGVLQIMIYAGNEAGAQREIGAESINLLDNDDKVGEYQLEIKDAYHYVTVFVLSSNFMAGGLGKAYSYKLQNFTDQATATPTKSSITVDGKSIAFEAYNIGGNNYFKLRDIAKAITGTPKNFEVSYDSTNKAIKLTSSKVYTSVGNELNVSGNTAKIVAKFAVPKIYWDGREVSLIGYNINGSNYFKLRDIGKLFDFSVIYNPTTKAIQIETSKSYIQ